MRLFLALMLMLALACRNNQDAANSNDAPEATVENAVNFDSLSIILEDIYELDQKYRLQMMESPTFDPEIAQLMEAADSSNLFQVAGILATHGWLPQSKISEKAADGLFLVIQHSPQEVMEQYLPLLQAAAAAGEASSTNAALMTDRVLMNQGKKQRYGTQARAFPPDWESFIWPIEEPEKVNELRAAAGFETTVEENAARLDARYDPDEALPKPNEE